METYRLQWKLEFLYQEEAELSTAFFHKIAQNYR
jgi:hypothetical protein